MIIVALADIHGDMARADALHEELAKADVVLLVGDITHFGRAKEARQVVDFLRKSNPRVLAVSGNCDHPEVEDYLQQEYLSLHRRSIVLDGVAFVGVGGSLPAPGRTPNEIFEHDFAQYLAEAASGVPKGIPTILVAHQPPLNTVNDLASAGLHVGSKSVRDFIEERQPLLCFTGHIHEGIGTDTIGETKVVNPGPFRHGHYARARLSSNVESLDILKTPQGG